MDKDIGWKMFFSDDERFADIINGIGCGGEQIIKEEDLQDVDTQVWITIQRKWMKRFSFFKNHVLKIRDTVRKAAFGVNFAIIGIESQEHMDYSLPMRGLLYDVGTYERQMQVIRKAVRKEGKGLSPGEYLYGFKKTSRLHPAVTIVLYSGKKEWDGAQRLHEIIDFTDIPKQLQEMVADYKVNLVDIQRLQDTSMFKTDVKQVFDFIRCANDKRALKELTENDEYYKNMEEAAFDVAVLYTNATELIETKENYLREGNVNMCQALKELIAEGREEGRIEGADAKFAEMVRKLAKHQSVEEIAEVLEESVDTIRSLIERAI